MRFHPALSALFVFALAIPASAQSDTELFAEARIAFDRFNDCQAAKAALTQMSTGSKSDAMWIIYMGNTHYCLKEWDQALQRFSQYDRMVLNQQEVLDKIGEIRYMMRSTAMTRDLTGTWGIGSNTIRLSREDNPFGSDERFVGSGGRGSFQELDVRLSKNNDVVLFVTVSQRCPCEGRLESDSLSANWPFSGTSQPNVQFMEARRSSGTCRFEFFVANGELLGDGSKMSVWWPEFGLRRSTVRENVGGIVSPVYRNRGVCTVTGRSRKVELGRRN